MLHAYRCCLQYGSLRACHFRRPRRPATDRRDRASWARNRRRLAPQLAPPAATRSGCTLPLPPQLPPQPVPTTARSGASGATSGGGAAADPTTQVAIATTAGAPDHSVQRRQRRHLEVRSQDLQQARHRVFHAACDLKLQQLPALLWLASTGKLVGQLNRTVQ